MKTISIAHRKQSASARPARRPAAPPIKLFYRIQEVADMTGLKPSVLRYWETEFRELSPEKDASDQRRYRPSDVRVIRAIRKLLYEDRYTIKGAKARLREALRREREAENAPSAPQPARRSKSQALPQVIPVASRPSLTEFRTRRKESADEATRRRLNQTLRNLRLEVNTLLGMLS